MDVTLYLIMIFQPILFFIYKLSASWHIYERVLRKKHSRSYIQKNRGNVVKAFFALNFKQEIGPFLFALNVVLGCACILSVMIALIFTIMLIFGYRMNNYALIEWVPYFLYGSIEVYIVAELWVSGFDKKK